MREIIISDPLSHISNRERRVIILVGPTASGKTTVSLQLAKILDGEIVSADSRQFYQFMDIGTAKPSKEELLQVYHHFINCLTPDQNFNAAEYSKNARQVIDEIIERGKVPIVVGGSGLYIKALVDGFFEVESTDHNVRAILNERLEKEGAEKLLEELRIVDPVAASSMVPGNKKRIVRALEAFQVSGIPISQLQQKNIPADFTPCFVGLNWERKKLYERINLRVDKMFEEGLMDEVIKLQQLGYSPELNALQTVGYRDVFEHLSRKISFDRMMVLIKQNTRRYAKRQLTWFRADTRIKWFDVEDEVGLSDVSVTIAKYFENKSF